MKKLKFQNGDTMPILGLGTWKSKPGEVYDAVREAIRIGYRHIDCAAVYGNETEIGQAFEDAFKAGEVKRENLWVTSKLWNTAHRRHQVQPALEKTLSDLRLDYLDLYLMHWPVALKENAPFPYRAEDMIDIDEIPLQETWEAMEDCHQKGLTRHIGVSNFNIKNLKKILQNARQQPEMNQVELQPLLPQDDLLEFCGSENIHLTAYSPLGSRDRSTALKANEEPDLFENKTIVNIAERHGCTPAQVLIAWAVARGTAVIPKSVNPARLQQNFEAANIDLTGEDMSEIARMDQHFRFISGSFWTAEGSPYTREYLWGS
jgi:alcohol dehydrogenase (NADP+)